MKNIKKILALILTLGFALSAMPMFSLAAGVVERGTCGADGNNLTWTLDSNGLLIISGEGAMKDYERYSVAPWYDYTVQTVIIDDGVTTIGEYAFYYCDSLTSVTIPVSVTTIGSYEFRWCPVLADIYYG